MRPRHLIHAAMAVMIVLLSRSLAAAEPVRINLELDVRHTFGDLSELFGAPISVGDVFRMSLVYDTAATDVSPSPVEGHYRSAGSLELGAAPLVLAAGDIYVFDELFSPIPGFDDGLTALSSVETFPGFHTLQADLSFRGTGRVGDALPQSAAEFLAAFGAGGGFRFDGWKNGVNPPFDSGSHQLIGTVRVVADVPQPVPEPGTLLLVATGGLAFLKRRRPRARG
jgi:hypothetical protein